MLAFREFSFGPDIIIADPPGPFLECLDTDPARKEAFLAENAKRFDRTLVERFDIEPYSDF